LNENNYKDYYEILEVHKKASQEVIKRAYTILAKKYHPDVNQHSIESSNKRMAELNEAYEVLSDMDKRQRYDLLSEYLGNQSLNWNYGNSYDNTNKENRSDQYTVRTNSRSNIVKPSNISKRYNHNSNNKKLTILTYSVVVAIVAYSLITNIIM